MRVIGITGGVGAGKSEIMKILKENSSSYILLADSVAHEVEKKGDKCYDALIELLGDSILADDGQIDKKKMAEAIFSGKDSNVLTKVNAIVHPRVKERILELIDEQRQLNRVDFFFLEAALLIEDGYLNICDEIWYVYASVETRTKRLMSSRGYSPEKIKDIMSKQNDEATFRKYCSFVIDNDKGLDEVRACLIDKLKEALDCSVN